MEVNTRMQKGFCSQSDEGSNRLKRKHKIFHLTMALVLLVTLSGKVGSTASSKGSVAEEAGIEAGSEYKVVTVADVMTIKEIFPAIEKLIGLNRHPQRNP
jgi:hypothetical protein